MLKLSNKADCCGCTACKQVCPANCITMVFDDEGFLYPLIDEAKCIDCGLCERVCPIIQKVEQPDGIPDAYAIYNLDNEIRLNSSSGGVFTMLSNEVLNNNGIVFGAVMSDDNRRVFHISTGDKKQLEKLRGSKYLQSDINNTYKEAEQLLKNGREVLFSGTPCEIEGLKTYLRKPYDNLLCVDIICHGVPSPKLWGKYVDYREKIANAKVIKTSFRNKTMGWKNSSLLLKFSNGVEYVSVNREDMYMQMFSQNFCLRPSCYECNFKKKNRLSDITLADFWGYRNKSNKMDDNNGLSLVLVHSEKGDKYIQKIKGEAAIEVVEFESAIASNTPLLKSVNKPLKRDNFMNDIDLLSIDELNKKYVNYPNLLTKTRNKIKALIAKLLPKKLKEKIKKRFL